MKLLRTCSKTSNRHEIFLEVCDILASRHLPSVAEQSGVSYPTLWNWVYGTTIHPHSRTLFAVIDALGYNIRLVRARRRPHLRAV